MNEKSIIDIIAIIEWKIREYDDAADMCDRSYKQCLHRDGMNGHQGPTPQTLEVKRMSTTSRLVADVLRGIIQEIKAW